MAFADRQDSSRRAQFINFSAKTKGAGGKSAIHEKISSPAAGNQSIRDAVLIAI
jgi:hypothetical protein